MRPEPRFCSFEMSVCRVSGWSQWTDGLSQMARSAEKRWQITTGGLLGTGATLGGVVFRVSPWRTDIWAHDRMTRMSHTLRNLGVLVAGIKRSRQQEVGRGEQWSLDLRRSQGNWWAQRSGFSWQLWFFVLWWNWELIPTVVRTEPLVGSKWVPTGRFSVFPVGGCYFLWINLCYSSLVWRYSPACELCNSEFDAGNTKYTPTCSIELELKCL